MSFDPETTRIVRSWLDEGVTQLPDRVLDSVLDQVPATPQRRVTWWPARRLSTMNTTLKFGLAAAVVVAAALIGINYLAEPSVGGPGPTDAVPSQEPIPTPEATPVATSTPTPDGLPQGAYLLNDGEPLEGLPTLRLTVTIPAPGWSGDPPNGILVKDDNAGAPDGAGLLTFFGEPYVYGDPCRWESTRPDVPATTVDEVVAALSAQATRDATAAVDVTIDGHAGKSMTLHVPHDWPTGPEAFVDCDQGLFGSWGMDGSEPGPYRYHQDPGQIDRVWVLDVDGELVIIDTAYYEDTPQSVVDELEAIVESASFD